MILLYSSEIRSHHEPFVRADDRNLHGDLRLNHLIDEYGWVIGLATINNQSAWRNGLKRS